MKGALDGIMAFLEIARLIVAYMCHGDTMGFEGSSRWPDGISGNTKDDGDCMHVMEIVWDSKGAG